MSNNGTLFICCGNRAGRDVHDLPGVGDRAGRDVHDLSGVVIGLAGMYMTYRVW